MFNKINPISMSIVGRLRELKLTEVELMIIIRKIYSRKNGKVIVENILEGIYNNNNKLKQ